MNTLRSLAAVFLATALCLSVPGSASAQAKRLSKKATLYVPAYSSIFH